MRQRVSAVLTFHSVVTCYDCHASSFTIRQCCRDSEGTQGWRICAAQGFRPLAGAWERLALDTGIKQPYCAGPALQGAHEHLSTLGFLLLNCETKGWAWEGGTPAVDTIAGSLVEGGWRVGSTQAL